MQVARVVWYPDECYMALSLFVRHYEGTAVLHWKQRYRDRKKDSPSSRRDSSEAVG